MQNRYRPAIILGAALMAIITTACNAPSGPTRVRQDAAAATEDTERIVIPVEAGIPERGSISAYFETNTRIEADVQVEVNSEGSGQCVAVNFEEGDHVRKGDVLAELDKRDVEAQIHQSEVQVRQARVDYERSKQLIEADLIARAEYDSARFSYENALANLRLQRIQLDHMTIKAPVNGIVTRRVIQVGQLVTSGMPVCEIVDPESYVLHINPPERELSRLEMGQTARFTVDALPDREFTARISRINPSVDRESGTIRVRLDIDPEFRHQLRESAFTRVRLVMETREDALLVPRDAVIEDTVRHYVFIVDADDPEDVAAERIVPSNMDEPEITLVEKTPTLIARRVEVVIGLEDSDHFEILSGINENDLIITMGQRSLRPDSEIRVSNMDAELAAHADITIQEALAAAEAEHEARRRQSESQRAQDTTQDAPPDAETESE